jgi:hypothetical protein
MRGRYWWLLAALIVTIAFIRFREPYLNAPLWDVQVADFAGHPLSGITVMEDYEDYSCETDSHIVNLVTNADGRVQFQPAYLQRNLFGCAKQTIIAAGAGVHASFGRSASVTAMDNDKYEMGFATEAGRDIVVDWSGSPEHMNSLIKVKQRASPN